MRLPSCSCTTRSQGWGMPTSTRIKLCRVACICSPAGAPGARRVHKIAASPAPTSRQPTQARCTVRRPLLALLMMWHVCLSTCDMATTSIHSRRYRWQMASWPNSPKENASEVVPRSGLPPRHSLPVCGCQHRCSHPDLDWVRSRRDTACFADWTT